MRIGLLGASRIARDAIIAPSHAIPRVRLAGIAARDTGRAREYAATYGIARTHADYAELVAAPDIDLVYNALPVSHHAAWTMAALKAGKHVLCEKPFAMNAREAQQVLDCARQYDGRVIEAFHDQHHPAFAIFSGWIESGRIGTIQAIDSEFSVEIRDEGGTEIRHRSTLGGGAMMDLGCYPLRWIHTAMRGAHPESIVASADLTPSGVDETMRVTLNYAGGVSAKLFTTMRCGTEFSARITVTGDQGTIRFDNPVAPHNGASLVLETGKVRQSAPISPVSTYCYQLGDVTGAIETGSALVNEGMTILHQQQSIDAVYAAAGLANLRDTTFTQA